MRPVKTKPRFRCDFCRKVATEHAIARHEAICWRNPDRVCPACDNTGQMDIDHSGDVWRLVERIPCYYCAQRHDPWDSL